MTLTRQIKNLLTSVSNVYEGEKPDAVDNVVVISRLGGNPRSLAGSKMEEPTFMILVRNTDYQNGQDVCDTVKDLLHGQSTDSILMIEQLTDIKDVGIDANGRFEFSINFRCYYRR